MESKAQIRAMMRLKEKDFLESGKAAGEDRIVISALECTPLFSQASTILAYMSMSGEVSTHEAIARWHEAGKRIVLPLVCGDELKLKEYAPSSIKEGYRGILEPSDDAQDVPAEEVELAIIPGIAFTENGLRMGRGKGYYDRLLPALDCPKYGICYSFRVVDGIPTDPWDAPLDGLIHG